jgi:hypothetical protein
VPPKPAVPPTAPSPLLDGALMLDPEGLGDLLDLDLEQRSVHVLHAHAAYHRALGPRAQQPSQPVPLRHGGAAKGPRAEHPPRPAPPPPAVPSERVTTSAFQQMTGDGAPKRRRIEPAVPLNLPLSRGNGAGILRCANVLSTNLLSLNAPLTIGFIKPKSDRPKTDRPKKMCVKCDTERSRTYGKNNDAGDFECFACSPTGKVRLRKTCVKCGTDWHRTSGKNNDAGDFECFACSPAAMPPSRAADHRKKICVKCEKERSRNYGKNNGAGDFECFTCSPTGKVLPRKTCVKCGKDWHRTSGKNNDAGHFECFKCSRAGGGGGGERSAE